MASAPSPAAWMDGRTPVDEVVFQTSSSPTPSACRAAKATQSAEDGPFFESSVDSSSIHLGRLLETELTLCADATRMQRQQDSHAESLNVSYSFARLYAA